MDREDRTHTRLTDTYIEELLQNLEERGRTCQSLVYAPELRMTYDIRRAYQAEASEDARSLERVLTKLREDQPKTYAQEHYLVRVARPPERISHRLDTSARGKSSRRWQERAGVLAAVIFFTLLVGGLLVVLAAVHAGQTLPTASSGSQVVTSVALSANANQTVQASTMQMFTAGQTIWLTSMINAENMTSSGVLTAKWYENDRLEGTSVREIKVSKKQAVAMALKTIPIRAHQVFMKPGEGKVEVYWNGQLVAVLHFRIK